MGNAAIGCVAALTWLATLYKARGMRSGSAAARALASALFFLAVALTFSVGNVYTGVDGVVGRHNLAQLFKDGCVVLSACSTQILLLNLVADRDGASRKSLQRFVFLGLTLALMVAFFAAAPLQEESVTYIARHGSDGEVLEYRLIYLLYVAYAFVDIARLCRRFARVAVDPLLSSGLQFVAAGGVAGVFYAALSGVALIVARDGNDSQVNDFQSASKAVIVIATLLVVGGSTLPAWGNRVGLGRRARRVRARHQLEKIEPLWTALTAAVPGLTLDDGPVARSRGADDEETLYRRVIEIEDARLALRPHVPVEIDLVAAEISAAHGWNGRETDAAVEAARLSASLKNLAVGAAERHAVVPSRRRDGTNDLQTEAGWLGLVTERFTDREFSVEVNERLALVLGGEGHGNVD